MSLGLHVVLAARPADAFLPAGRLPRTPVRPRSGCRASPRAGIPIIGGARIPEFAAVPVTFRLWPRGVNSGATASPPENWSGAWQPGFPRSGVPALARPGVPVCRASRWRKSSAACEGHTAAMTAVVVSGRTGFIVSSRWAFPPENWPHQPAQGAASPAARGATRRAGCHANGLSVLDGGWLK